MAIKYTEEQLNNVDKSFLVQMFLNQQEEIRALSSSCDTPILFVQYAAISRN